MAHLTDAANYGLDLGGEGTPTSACIQLFDSFRAAHATSGPLLQGLTILWALEKIYLDAWSYAKEQGEATFQEDLDGGALRIDFIPNWTSEQFKNFVRDTQECLDSYVDVVAGTSPVAA